MEALLEPLSPELVLVCPDLREAAIARLVAPAPVPAAATGASVERLSPFSAVDVSMRVPVILVALLCVVLSVARMVVTAVGVVGALVLAIGLLS